MMVWKSACGLLLEGAWGRVISTFSRSHGGGRLWIFLLSVADMVVIVISLVEAEAVDKCWIIWRVRAWVLDGLVAIEGATFADNGVCKFRLL